MALFSVMVIVGAATISVTRRDHFRSISLGVLTLLLAWAAQWHIDIYISEKVANLPFLLFFLYIVYSLIYRILQSKNVTPDVILGAITGYIFLGYAGSIYFVVIHDLYPGSFGGAMNNSMNPIYYSFVCMTTLGFGDITPISNAAKGGTIILTIFGQFYIAVIVALLVSKYLFKSKTN
ncbi:MAG: ion channel [Salibacteraceae bacterium]